MKDAKYWIETLRLEPHPEGGYFRQTYKSELRILPEELPNTGRIGAERNYSHGLHPKMASGEISEWRTQGFGGTRAASTAICFLLEGDNFSAFHRLRSDEMWHFYMGSPVAVHVIDPVGEYSSILLGSDAEAGQVFQTVVPAGCWFGSEIAENSQVSESRPGAGQASYALVACTVAPGFEFEDFELARRGELEAKYPQHREIIRRLTRQ